MTDLPRFQREETLGHQGDHEERGRQAGGLPVGAAPDRHEVHGGHVQRHTRSAMFASRAPHARHRSRLARTHAILSVRVNRPNAATERLHRMPASAKGQVSEPRGAQLAAQGLEHQGPPAAGTFGLRRFVTPAGLKPIWTSERWYHRARYGWPVEYHSPGIASRARRCRPHPEFH